MPQDIFSSCHCIYASVCTTHYYTFLPCAKERYMQVLIICPAERMAEIGKLPEGFSVAAEIGIDASQQYDALIDLLYETDPAGHATALQQWKGKPVLLSAVALTCRQLPAGAIRINGWPHFFESHLVEACTLDDAARADAVGVLGLLGKRPEWVPDLPGMISARIVSSIINEAYFALSEGIATAEAIDTAMKLGTAYPLGPFAWAQKIGLQNVAALLHTLAQTEPRYKPCALLQEKAQEAGC
jgi:3-hydroxybutyryl-CoA dehydrogenase